jgi:hypothetical protein
MRRRLLLVGESGAKKLRRAVRAKRPGSVQIAVDLTGPPAGRGSSGKDRLD